MICAAKPSSTAACGRAGPRSWQECGNLGYLPGEPSEWDSDLLLDYMHEVSWWLYAEEPLRLAPEDVWRGTDVLREDSARHHIAQLRRMTLPPEALLLRRVEGLLFQTAPITRASAPWGKLLREPIEGARDARRPRCAARRVAGPPAQLSARASSR
jgi:hypothetical protein